MDIGPFQTVSDRTPTYEADEDFCYTYLAVWRVWITGVICILGTTGNTISVIMFHVYPEIGGSLAILMKALSWADFLHLILYSNVLWWPDLAWHSFGGDRIWDYTMYTYAYIWPLVSITLTCDGWYIVLISIHRYRAVSQPLKSSMFTTPGRLYKQILVITVFTILVEFPRFFEIRIVEIINPQTNQSMTWYEYTQLYENEYYQLFYKSIFIVFYKKYIPMAIISFSAILIIVTIKKCDRNQGKVGPSGKGRLSSVSKVSRVPLTVMITFLVTQLPICVYPIARLILEDYKMKTCSYFYLYATTADVIGLVNPSINCVFYLVLWKSFRRNLLRCCCSCSCTCSCCCCCKTSKYTSEDIANFGNNVAWNYKNFDYDDNNVAQNGNNVKDNSVSVETVSTRL